MAEKIAFDLVSPERLLVSMEADMVVVPGSEGEFGVLAGHAPVISTLRPGSLDIYEGDTRKESYFVAGGLAEVAGDRLTVLAEEAIPLVELDRAGLEKRIKDAEEDVSDASDEESRGRAQERLDHLRDMLQALG
jgi:F-type H+-transporting ATPase subunit epsilon